MRCKECTRLFASEGQERGGERAAPFVRERSKKQGLSMQTPKEDPVDSIRIARGSSATWLHPDSEGEEQSRVPEVIKARALATPLWILASCMLVVALREAREVLIPLMLAILFTFVLSGLVEALRRRHVPRGVSALILLLGMRVRRRGRHQCALGTCPGVGAKRTACAARY